jgi:hypothetical protein
MGVLRVRYPPGPGGTWIDITGIGTQPGISQDAADARYVNVVGDTMTGKLVINPSGLAASDSGLALGPVSATEGGQVEFTGSSGYRNWYADNYSGEWRVHDGSLVALDAVDGYRVAVGSGAWYIGRHPTHNTAGMWPAAKGSSPGNAYNILTYDAGGPLLLNSDSGNVELRTGNVARLLVNSAGVYSTTLWMQNNNIEGCNTLNANGVQIWGSGSLYWPNQGGGWYMSDGSYVRSINDRHVWLGGGWYGTNGGIQVGYGGVTNYGYCGDFNGSVRTGNLDTLGQCRITCNGGNGSAYYNHAYLAQNGAAARTGYSMHPGGTAKSVEMMQNNGYINFLNEGGDWYADLYAASITQVSQQKGKQDIAEWPSKTTEVNGASSRLSLIDVISFRYKAEYMLQQAESWLPDEDGVSHPRMHDCDIDDCDGTDAEPCQRVKEWRNHPHLGVIIEDLATVLPEAVGLDPDGNPGGMRLGSMIGFLVAVCKEQQDEIERIKARLPSAA